MFDMPKDEILDYPFVCSCFRTKLWGGHTKILCKCAKIYLKKK